MLFGFLHRVTIAIIDLKETIIFMVLYSSQICKENYADLLLFNLCSLYKCCISYICCIAAKFVGYVNSPKNLYTKFCLFVSFTLTPGLFPSWNNGNNLCKLIHISRSFWKKKLVLGR